MTCKGPPTVGGKPSAGREDDTTVPPKATLFCPDCGHSSHVTGDWEVLTVGRTARYRCPDCGTTVTERPAGTRGRPGLWGALLEGAGTLGALWWRAVLL